MFATERSRQNMRLAGALLLAIGARVYLSRGGAEAMVFTTPQLLYLDDVRKLLTFAALGVALSAAVAAAGKRCVGNIAAVGLGGVAGLLAMSQYNAILGAAIGLVVGLLVACGAFAQTLAALARVVAALVLSIACGAAALATQRDVSGGPGASVLLLMAAILVVAAFVIFRRWGNTSPVEWKRPWLRRLGQTSLCLVVIFGLWVSLTVDRVRRARPFYYNFFDISDIVVEPACLWRGVFKPIDFFRKPELTDDDLSHVRSFAELGGLNLSSSRVTDKGLAQLRDLPQLRLLVLDGTKINGEGFEHLATLPKLTTLSLKDTQVNDQSLGSLESLPGLRTLLLENTPISDAALKHVGKITTLGSLNLSGTKITDVGLSQLQGLASLGILGLSQTQITGDGLQHLAPLTWLQSLDLRQTQLADADLEKLPVLPRLERLWLDGTKVTDAGLAHLKKQPILYVVDAYETAITAEGADQFCKAMQQRATKPECIVNH
jgi:hypothetical protein